MAQVVVQVNDRPYTMQCADGEEGHLRELAQLLDREVNRIKDNVGAVGDVRVLLMAGLMVADQLAEARRRIRDLEAQVEGLRELRTRTASHGRSVEDQLAERLGDAAKRLEALAQGMEELA
jgi:cell division protein ZapA